MINLKRLFMTLLVVLVACSACTATPEDGHGGVVTGPGFVDLPLFQGWFDGQLAWYIFMGSNNIDYVRTLSYPYVPWFKHKGDDLSYMLYPKLTSALQGGASPVYMVTNYQQGLVFSAMPGDDTYSGIWQVNLVRWKKGVTPRPICGVAELPGADEADIIPTDVVLDLPIMVVGPLGSVAVAMQINAPAPPGTYYIPEAVKIIYAKPSGKPKPPPLPIQASGQDGQYMAFYGAPFPVIVLPTWPAYAQDPVTRKIVEIPVIITDSADPGLARHLQTNIAPALNEVDDANTEIVWYFRRGQSPPIPINQYLILQHPVTLNYIYQYDFNMTYEAYEWLRYWGYNTDYDASPVMDLQPLVRGTIPPYAVVSNPSIVPKLILNNVLKESGPALRVNVGLSPIPPDTKYMVDR